MRRVCGQVYEVALQLRGEAGARQVPNNPKVGYTHVYGAPGLSGVTIHVALTRWIESGRPWVDSAAASDGAAECFKGAGGCAEYLGLVLEADCL